MEMDNSTVRVGYKHSLFIPTKIPPDMLRYYVHFDSVLFYVP